MRLLLRTLHICLTVNLSPGHAEHTIIFKESRTLKYNFKMWLSTVQSFKTLRSVRKSFESKSKESKRRKEIVNKDMSKEERTKRRNTYQTKKLSKPKL